MILRTQARAEDEPNTEKRLKTRVEVESLFDLGESGGSNIARDKDSMIAEAFDSEARKG
jgi:hypothetical protein